MNLKTVQDIAAFSQMCIDLIRFRWNDMDEDTRIDIYHISEIMSNVTERINKTLQQQDVETTFDISRDFRKR